MRAYAAFSSESIRAFRLIEATKHMACRASSLRAFSAIQSIPLHTNSLYRTGSRIKGQILGIPRCLSPRLLKSSRRKMK